MKHVDGKMVGGPGECFVGCADLIETYHYPLAFSRPLPQVLLSPFLFPVHRSAIRTFLRYDILPLRPWFSPSPHPSPLFVHAHDCFFSFLY